MATVQPKKKPRGMPAILPPWWLREVRRQTRGHSLAEIAVELTDAVDRKPAWDRSTVGKFLKNKWPTVEMMLAFCRLYDLAPPFFVARSFEEANHLARESRRYDDAPATPDVDARRYELNEAREQLSQQIADQRRRLDSTDERSTSRRRPRGVDRGRPPAS